MFDDIWIQPAAGDAGGASARRTPSGTSTTASERCERHPAATRCGLVSRARSSRTKQIAETHRSYDRASRATTRTSRAGHRRRGAARRRQVVGWFQGRMEFGPRALGNRSILGDARNPEMQKRLNLKIKFREGFRPFAPSVLEEDVAEYFELDRPSPYMLLVTPVREGATAPAAGRTTPTSRCTTGSTSSARTCRRSRTSTTRRGSRPSAETTNPRYWELIDAFKRLTGCGVHRQHQLQRPRRADRLHAGRGLSLLHANGDGLPGDRRLRVREEGPASLRRARVDAFERLGRRVFGAAT